MFKERGTAVAKITAVNEFVVILEPIALEKMWYYVDNCQKEIGWLGTVSKYDNILLIEDVFLFKQEVHSATCEITPDGLSEFATELLSKPNGVDIWNKIKLWGHSHVNMSVSPSGQDNSQMKTFGEQSEWFLRVIANKNGEMEFTLYDFKASLIFENVRWIERKERSKELEEQIKNEIKDKVTEKTYTITSYGSGAKSYGNYWDDFGYGYDEGYRWDNKQQNPIKVDKKKEEKKVKNFKMNGVTIPVWFSEEELKQIAKDKDDNNRLIMIYDIGEANGLELDYEDAIEIISYAENKYPV
jgi:hypothetical protein